jgi:mono/diheme cytochrome c family protein
VVIPPISTLRRFVPVLLLGAAALLSSCRNIENMRNQARYEPLERSAFFPDGRSARPLPEGAVPQTGENQEESFLTGRSPDGELLPTAPISYTLDVLERGRERYDIYCSPCHGRDGYGQGMIVQRGFSPPPTFHSDRLRQAPDGHFYDAITNGFGQMASYAYRVDPEDRWAIVGYIRALQLSQNAREGDVPPEELENLRSGQP